MNLSDAIHMCSIGAVGAIKRDVWDDHIAGDRPAALLFNEQRLVNAKGGPVADYLGEGKQFIIEAHFDTLYGAQPPRLVCGHQFTQEEIMATDWSPA